MPDDAFERLYADQAEPLLAFLVYRTGDKALAEDLVADTFERVITARRRFDPRRGSEKTWLYSIAINRLTDHRRRAAAEGRAYEKVAMPGGTAEVEAPGEAIGERDELLTALRRLNREEREAIALRYGGELSIREIATVANTRASTVKMRIHRGLRKLRDDLD